MSSLFRVFPNDPVPPVVDRVEGLYVYTKDGRRLLDMTAGGTHYQIIGGSHPEVLSAMKEQLVKFTHMDYKIWTDPNTEKLADILLSRAEHKLNKVYFCGNSGGEACEASMKMSFQVHHDLGKKEKTWFISRGQSYHGSSTDALCMGERPNLMFYEPLFPAKRVRIPEHNQYRQMLPGETLDEYARRSAKQLEDKILEIGPEKVCGFVAETIMGGLVGDVPPAPNYWKYIREVCTKYDVHLILDEVYCGTGTSGKIFCCDWDGITPDFIFLGKTIAAGYGPISAVITSDAILDIIKKYQGRLQHTTTHQGYSLGVAAGVAVQKIIHQDELLNHVQQLGHYMMTQLQESLGKHEFFRNVRGRGLRFAMEIDCKDQNGFTSAVAKQIEEKHQILINGKWHRLSITPALNVTREQCDQTLEAVVKVFNSVASNWKA